MTVLTAKQVIDETLTRLVKESVDHGYKLGRREVLKTPSIRTIGDFVRVPARVSTQPRLYRDGRKLMAFFSIIPEQKIRRTKIANVRP